VSPDKKQQVAISASNATRFGVVAMPNDRIVEFELVMEKFHEKMKEGVACSTKSDNSAIRVHAVVRPRLHESTT
jgi:hypothetical protein